MIITFNILGHVLAIRLSEKEWKNPTMGLIEVDFLFYEGNLQVKKILSSVYPFLWVENSCPELFLWQGILKMCSFATLLKLHFGMGVFL